MYQQYYMAIGDSTQVRFQS